MRVTDTARHVDVDGLDVWVDERGDGPPVLLIAGLSDPAEAWTFQLEGLADQHRLIAFDNPGAGRTALPEELTVASMADVAAGVLDAVGVEVAHVMGFSGGSATAQEVALRHPERVASVTLVSTWARWDALANRVVEFLDWLPESAPSERAMLEAFFVWIYTARAHESGFVDAMIEDALAFEHPQPPEAFKAQLAAWVAHDAYDRLPSIQAPTLVVAGDEDIMTPPRLGRVVAERIPGARFEVLAGEAHQPFQESPEAFNAMVTAFWAEVDAAVRAA